MADNKSKKGKPDRDRINVGEDYEVRYWAEKFVVTRDELKEAVRKVVNRPGFAGGCLF